MHNAFYFTAKPVKLCRLLIGQGPIVALGKRHPDEGQEVLEIRASIRRFSPDTLYLWFQRISVLASAYPGDLDDQTLNGNFHPPYDVVLDAFAQIGKIGAVAGNSHDQVAVVLRMLLRIE